MNRETDPVDACRGRVLVVASELPPGPGGIGTHAHQLSVALDELGFDVALLGSQHYAAPAEQKRFRESSPIAISRLPDGPNPLVTARRRLSALRRALSAHRPDVVIASGGRVLWFAVPASVRAGVPVVSVIHGSELGGPAWQRRLTRRVIEQSDRVVAVSAFTAGLIREMAAHVDATVIPNGADGTRFAPDPSRRQRFRERWGLGDRPVVLTVGNLTERKGQRKVIEALPAVAESVPDVAYVLVGAPTDREDMAARAAELGVSDRLFITGQLDSDEVTDAYAAADLFAMTSTSTSSGDVEGFGIAVVEAALSGIPAVVAAGTGAAEAVIDGRTGLVSSTEATPLATALASLLTDGRRRVSMGREANLCARSSGTWRHRAADYGEILDELVAAKRKPRIVVISHTEHYRATDGSIVAFGPTTREIDHLATLASELVHVAPLHGGPPPGVALPAEASNVRFVPVPPAGGPRPVDRVLALRAVPAWAIAIDRELRHADVAHVRCPAGISMVALSVLLARRSPRARWVKYAGNWAPEHRDAATYRLQRWWLRNGLARATVSVNGRWPNQPDFVRAFDNPTLTDDEVEAGRRAAAAKTTEPPFRVVFVGRLEAAKGVRIAIEAVEALHDEGMDIELDVLGDGPLRSWVEERSVESSAPIRSHGWVTRSEVESFLTDAHALVLPSSSEGFPKVLAEALAFGCTPVTAPISSVGQVLRETGGGVLVDDGRWSDGLRQAFNEHDRLAAKGLDGVGRFTYATYLDRVGEVLAAETHR